jgi:hypothetical protein
MSTFIGGIQVGIGISGKADKRIVTKSSIIVNGDRYTVKGDDCIVNGDCSIVEGKNCTVNGEKCIVTGDGCTVTGNKCIVSSKNCYVTGDHCIVNGTDCIVTGEHCIGTGVRPTPSSRRKPASAFSMEAAHTGKSVKKASARSKPTRKHKVRGRVVRKEVHRPVIFSDHSEEEEEEEEKTNGSDNNNKGSIITLHGIPLPMKQYLTRDYLSQVSIYVEHEWHAIRTDDLKRDFGLDMTAGVSSSVTSAAHTKSPRQLAGEIRTLPGVSAMIDNGSLDSDALVDYPLCTFTCHVPLMFGSVVVGQMQSDF